jgi:hypothetical protein
MVKSSEPEGPVVDFQQQWEPAEPVQGSREQ